MRASTDSSMASSDPDSRSSKHTKLSMFLKNKSYPRLRGRAADIRGLPDTILWDANMIEGDMTHRQIRMVLALNVNANTLETYSPRFGYFAVPGALSFLT